MEQCDYCGEEFPDEQSYLDHLRSDHMDELGPIDRRRVAPPGSDESRDWFLYVTPVAGVALVGLVLYFVFFAGTSGGSAPQPHSPGSVHIHGDIAVMIAGEQLDFSQPRYQYANTQNSHFHFEPVNGVPNGEMWHVHSQDVTLAYGMSSLDIEVTENNVTYDGTTYRDADPDTTVNVTVNGESVNPRTYVLRDGDTVRITVETSD